jgi:molecular chaperone GrpE (heat shock protein)
MPQFVHYSRNQLTNGMHEDIPTGDELAQGAATSDTDAVVQDEQQLKGDIVRLSADLENLKKDVLTQSAESARRATEQVVRAVAPALDALLAAARAMENGNGDAELSQWREGLQKVRDRFEQSFVELGIVPVPVDGTYDPKYHEAVERVAGEEHAIVDVAGLGWMWKDSDAVIVPARVHVGSGE